MPDLDVRQIKYVFAVSQTSSIPLSAKTILVLYGLYLLSCIYTIFMGDMGPALLKGIITLAVFTGLCNRSIIAWQWARWTSALSALILLVVGILGIQSLFRQPFTGFLVLLSFTISAASFWILGLKDAKSYFTRLETEKNV